MDVAHIKIEVVDENGAVVPDADNLIQLKAEGAGKLIGFDNGNPADHTSMKSNERKMFNGLALVVIQSDNTEGKINITASSPLIKGTSIEIFTKKINTPVATVESLKK